MVGASSRPRSGPLVGLSAGLLLALVALCWPGEAALVDTASSVALAEHEVASALRVEPGGANVDDVVRAELPLPADGADRRQPPPVAVPNATIWAWVDDLADDDVRGNAGRAMIGLRAAGEAAVPALESALLSRDRQQRLYASAVLRQVIVTPSRALLEVSVEALRRDLPPELLDAAGATRFLAPHAHLAGRELLWGLGADDAQQQFLCAFLLACGGHDVGRERACAILIDHLADNSIRGDALMSAHALYRFGPSVLGTVRTTQPWANGQARDLLRLVELDLLGAPRDDTATWRRERIRAVTRLYHDPATEFDLWRSPVATW